MAMTPFQLQIVGLVVLVLLGLGFLWWIVYAVMRWHEGRPMYVLPETKQDDEAADDDDDAPDLR